MKSYLQKIWYYKKGKWPLLILFLFFIIAIFGDFLANEKPIVCKYDSEFYFPVCHDYLVQANLTKPYDFKLNTSWSDINFNTAIYPPIRFKSERVESNHKQYVPPGTAVEIGHTNKRYWLGSDSIGRDVAAGLISGTRIALLIAFLSMLIAFTIGITVGVLSGYFGDRFFQINLLILVFFLLISGFVLFQVYYNHLSMILAVIIISMLVGISMLVHARFDLKGQVYLPLDIIVLRIIEVFKSIPALFILLALLPLINSPSILYVILIIGLLRWPTIGRVLRAEMLKLKEQDFVMASRSLGMSHFQILRHHILPNALPPIITILAFGLAGTVLLEATLSFLGIGLSADTVTWGSMLSEARQNFNAWWLALFPGMAIFLLVVSCNYLGEITAEINRSN